MPALILSCSVDLGGDDVTDGVDPRDRRGRRYPVPLVGAAACAVAAGARSYAAVGHWLPRSPQDALTRLSFPVRGALEVRQSKPTAGRGRLLGRPQQGTGCIRGSPRFEGIDSTPGSVAGGPRGVWGDGHPRTAITAGSQLWAVTAHRSAQQPLLFHTTSRRARVAHL